MARVTLAIILSLSVMSAIADPISAFVPTKDTEAIKALLIKYSSLKDPFTTRFRKVVVRKLRAPSGAINRQWCGELNAKNSIASYTGWAKFVVIEGDDKPSILIAHDELTRMNIRVLCDGPT